MAQFPALPIWTDAFIGDTQHLTTSETGAYFLLLMVAWRDPDCSLPNDEKVLARLTRSGKNWPRMREAVMRFWHLEEDGRWHQKRLTKERLRALKSYSLRLANLQKTKKSGSVAGQQTISISSKKEDPVLHQHPVLPSNTEPSTARAAAPSRDPRYGEVCQKVEAILNVAFPFARQRIDGWLRSGADPEEDIYPAIERLKGNWRGRDLSYFDGAIADSLKARTSPLAPGIARIPKFDAAAYLKAHFNDDGTPKEQAK